MKDRDPHSVPHNLAQQEVSPDLIERLYHHYNENEHLTIEDHIRTLKYLSGRNEGEDGRFRQAVDHVALLLAKDTPDFKQSDLKDKRGLSNEQIERNRQLRDMYKSYLFEALGYDEGAINDITEGKLAVEEQIQEAINAGIEVSADNVLEVLGFIEVDDDSEETYYYPFGLLPKSVDDKLALYLDRVDIHVELGIDFSKNKEGISADDVMRADQMRRNAHDAIARDLSAVLGLEFSVARRLVAKIRDHANPTVETRESVVTGEAILASQNEQQDAGHERQADGRSRVRSMLARKAVAGVNGKLRLTE